MARKAKYTTDQIIKVCEEYLSGAKSPKELAREYSMKKKWSKNYFNLGKKISSIRSGCIHKK